MLDRIKTSLAKARTWYPMLSYLLFAVAVYVLTAVVGELDRGIQLRNLRLIVLMAVFMGAALSLLRKPNPGLLSLISFASGVIVSFMVIGDLLPPFLAYLRSGIAYLLSRIQKLFSLGGTLPDPAGVQSQWHILNQDIVVLKDRLLEWLGTLPESIYDPVSLNLVWGIIIWLTTLWVYWFVLKRKQVVTGFMPALLIIAWANVSIESGLFSLALMLGIGLLLTVLSKQARLEEYWQRNKLSFSEIIIRRAAQHAIYLSAGIVIFSIAITSPELEDFIDELRERRQKAQSSQVAGTGEADLLLPEEEPEIGAEEVLTETADGWLPNVHLIGNDPELAEIDVFTARVQGLYSVPGQRQYFRSATYENYSLRGWRNEDKDYFLIPPEQEFEIDFTPNEQLIYQKVILLRDFPEGNLMYAVGELAAANVSYYGSYHTKFVNNTYTDLFASVTNETQYVAYSISPYFTEASLRATSQEYPSWVSNKYLELPDIVTDRVFDLALSLTATEPTPYDRALVIEEYLRGLEYSLEIPSPPKNADIADYFLFELKKGYCDYFASAMVVLARAAGIPARLATGYLASSYDPETSQYIVTADQAHSWAEVYFPEYGWVTFEPTAGQPALDRSHEYEALPEELALEPEFENLLLEQPPKKFTLVPGNLFILTGELAIVLALVLAAYHWIDSKVLLAMAPKMMLARVYRRLRRSAKRIGVKTSPTDTPLEAADILREALASQAKKGIYRTVLRSAPDNSASILTTYNQAAYSTEPINDAQRIKMVAYWGRLRWQLIAVRILIKLEPIQATWKRVWFRLQQPA